MLDRDLLKTWFKTRAKPTQSQFWQWIDGILFKGEKVPVADVDGLQTYLDNFQASLNDIIPNTLVSGGQVSIASDDGTNIVIHIPDTAYKLKKVPFSILAQDVTIIRPTDPTLSRFDVFYLDTTGFHVLTGTLSTTPVKPQLLSGLELTSMLVGHDNSLEMVNSGSNVTKAYVDAADSDLQTQIDTISLTAGPAGADGLSAYQVAVNNGFVGTEAAWLASLDGPQGIQGVAGAPGADGAQGIQGVAGADGAQGIQGIQGVAGADGVDGLSAYQVAVNNGYVGTEAAWLASLDGPQGIQGVAGAPGADGAQGIQGVAGADGAQGIQGIQGVAGADGLSAYQIAVNNGYVGTEAEWNASVTLQGNTFNGAGQLLQLDGSIRLPAVDGSQLTNLPSSGGVTRTAGNKLFLYYNFK